MEVKIGKFTKKDVNEIDYFNSIKKCPICQKKLENGISVYTDTEFWTLNEQYFIEQEEGYIETKIGKDCAKNIGVL
jgi:hypothetical protein